MYLRHIELDGAYNFRDLGGYSSPEGHSTRWKKVFRSDSLARLSDRDWTRLEKLGIGSIIDLRSSSEVDQEGLRLSRNFDYHRISLMKALDEINVNSRDFMEASDPNGSVLSSMVLDYTSSLFDNLEAASRVLSLVEEKIEDGGLVFMCSAGKDRTGIIAALILYLSGVREESIVADYMVSATYNTRGINKKLSGIPRELRENLGHLRDYEELLKSKPQTMLDFLKGLREKNIEKALAESGFSLFSQDMLREKFTEKIIF